MEKHRKHYPILYSLLLFFLLVGLVPLVITNYRFIINTEEIMNKNLWDTQNRDVKKISTSIKSALLDLEGDIRLMAESQGISSIDVPTRHLFLRFLQKRNHWIKHIYVHSLRVSPRIIEDPLSKPSTEFLNYFSDRTIFNKVMAGQEYHFGPFNSPERTYIYGINILPIETNDGIIEGALYCEVELNFLIDFITEDISEFGKQAFIIDNDFKIIAHTDLNLIGRDVRFLNIDPGTFAMFVASTFRFVDKKNEEFSGSYISIPEKNWWVVMYEPTLNARWFISGMKWNMGKMGIITAIFSIILAALFAGTLSRPIHQLSIAALKIGDGHFDQQINIKSRNELGQLAETFNYMTGKLQEYTTQLEKYAKEMQELFFSSIQSLSAAIDEKDPYTRGHSERVTLCSTAIARELNLTEDEIEDIRIASLLHDVGKIGIHDSVLGKPGKLDDEERILMEQHPVLGANIMSPIKQLKKIIPGMLEHHEKYNGSGYPYGLTGDKISLMGRIIAVADTFDAMTTDRPYQKAMPGDYVIEKIIKWKNERFDPEVVDAFVRAYKKDLVTYFHQNQDETNESEH
ncbi:MAG: hypothetical protein A2161_05640 [Candidatus Schekmanbacteria bacterium RBG_13_48_7]|uniref:Phosphohydrolase n=1 Tax=Candidatus Schekmanbacteria bacterium RBG_13_48_7 TaxID=1817878 RepID=A0A1F7S4R9_9BACT|nr:MAG: hypothetical protein A2161_05640 [Candidatus Schekmanbacteria bacterium RBG_13_48_7]